MTPTATLPAAAAAARGAGPNGRPVVHHIPVCPFSQRLEILLALKGLTDAVVFQPVDITRPRDPVLLALTGGSAALPVLVTPEGLVLRESLVILRWLEMRFPLPPVARRDADGHAVENLVVSVEGALVNAGYALLMNQDPARREALQAALLREYARLGTLLCQYGAAGDAGPWLFDRYGWAETVFTPIFVRFAFLAYYEGFELPDEAIYARVRCWRDACLAHPAAQQVSAEEVIKRYHDYALGHGNGAVPPGRGRSSFVTEPHWRGRPWPPRGKGGPPASDAALGL